MRLRESSHFSLPVQIKEKMIGGSLFLLTKEARLFFLGTKNSVYLVTEIVKNKSQSKNTIS